MSKIALYLYILLFLFVFITRMILFYISGKRKKKKRKREISVEKLYLMHRFKLKREDVDNRSMNIFLSLNDAFILTVVMVLAFEITDKYLLQVLIGIVSVFALIFVTNEIIGKLLVGEKGKKKNE